MKRKANESDEAQRLASRLLRHATPVEPPKALRDRVLARIRDDAGAPAAATAPVANHDGTQVWRRWSGDDPKHLHTVPANQGDWEPTSVPGVEVRRLFVDSGRQEVTMLVRMAAGSAYPPHRHAGPEQCLVLTGDLSVGVRRLQAGDFQYAPASTEHEVQSTEGGCTLLIISSLHDEIMA